MSPQKSHYVCQSCGYQTPQSWGKCPQCGTWASMVEEVMAPARAKGWEGLPGAQEAKLLTQLVQEERVKVQVGIPELDRVLGGGIVPGGVTLVGGDPGIGKSTLLLQALGMLAGQGGLKALYVSGEESLTQTKMRADRLGISPPDLYGLAETSLEAIFSQIDKVKPQVMVIDSIQTVYSSTLESAPGSISQIRETAARIIQLTKASALSTFLIGHVTKEGTLAGPRALEHLVDTVVYFEGEAGSPYRILRVVKNRFGPTDEIGVFEMREAGLTCVANPSSLFLSERAANVSGSTVLATLKGTRPILVEVQALVSSPTFGLPRRTAVGIDPNRVSLLMAVLEKRAGLNLSGSDLFVNVAGGIRIEEPAADLAVVAAIASCFRNKPLAPETFLFGEVGLTGEVRAVRQAELRVKEGAKLGFLRCLLPLSNKKELKSPPPVPIAIGRQAGAPVEITGVRSVSELLEVTLA